MQSVVKPIQDPPKYFPKRKYMWTTFADFFKQKQKFGRQST